MKNKLMLLVLAALLLPAVVLAKHSPEAESATGQSQHEDEHPHKHGEATGHDHDEVPEHTELSTEVAAKSGIEVQSAEAGEIRRFAHLFGVIAVIPEQQWRISAPYAGLVQQLPVKVGDKVQAGQLLAKLQHGVTLQSYSLQAPAAAEVTARFANPGERAGEAALLQLSDFSSVYLELSAFPGDLAGLKPGNAVLVADVHGQRKAETVLSYLAPQMTEGHIARARAIVQNPDGFWRPGMHVKADVEVSRRQVSVRVLLSALQRMEGKTVVFVREGEKYKPRPVELGERDDLYVEVLSGLSAGEVYVSQNSFLLKADLLKSGAGHEH
ncbi:efflux RND transporter periplasmic adaptor subunit [Rheinheimera sp.]|uniref:efflux RND transporter periplasmic adaptor subunit n=1 Tax=Rheinheimera sp. TaxID=1869214 RepID=UPI00307E6958